MTWQKVVRNVKFIGRYLSYHNNTLRVIIPSFVGGFFLGANTNFKMPQCAVNLKRIITPVAVAMEKDENIKRNSFNFIADAVDIAAPSVVRIEVVGKHWNGQISSVGSGFFVTEDGIVLSNAHVVKNASLKGSPTVKVHLSTGETYNGVIIDVDPVSDLAAIKLVNEKQKKFPYLKLGGSVRAGEWVAALGSPLQLSNTVTAGIVSSLHRPGGELGLYNQDMGYIQTDAAINVGNSGGPLINLEGEVIGINCFTVQQAAGISFAIPANVVKEFLKEALNKDSSNTMKKKFYIGISMLSLSPDILLALQQRNPEFNSLKGGVLVARINSGSPSERSGLLIGDVILSINGKPVKSSRDVYNEVCRGANLVMQIQRKSQTLSINVSPEISSNL
uniref:Serine protease HTRA2,mitochondrial n=1 Tax=Hydra vulgaris TaxID=6087 RepID=T2MI67_HYDVU